MAEVAYKAGTDIGMAGMQLMGAYPAAGQAQASLKQHVGEIAASTNRLAKLISALESSAQSLSIQADRLMGPVPQNPEAGLKECADGCDLSALSRQIDRFERALVYLNNAAVDRFQRL